MKLNRLGILFIFLAPLVLLSGCATDSALNEGPSVHYNQPAYPSNLKLFHSSTSEDVLVQYDEWWRGKQEPHPRAYWLEKNKDAVERKLKPDFTSLRTSRGLVSIPVVEPSAESIPTPPSGFYAIIETNGASFTLYRKPLDAGPTATYEPVGTFQLPFYMGKSERVRQVFLTSTTAVVVTVGLIVLAGALIALAVYSQSGN
jgi:hypothetical protein